MVLEVTSPKVAIIGLDGAIPETAKLVGIKGNMCELISTIPPYTPPAWTSILTGTSPSVHGVIGWQRVNRKSGTVRLTTSFDVKVPRLSELLELSHMKSVLINLPLTYPFEGIRLREKSIIVSDWAAPVQAIFPKRLEVRYKEHLVEPPHRWARADRDYPKRVKEFTEKRVEMYLDILERQEWDMFFVVFSETDWLSHKYPEILGGEVKGNVKSVFKGISKFIEEVRSEVDYLFVVSDHGFGRVNRVFSVNQALAEHGFIRYSPAKARIANYLAKTLPSSLLRRFAAKTGKSSVVSYVAKDAVAAMIEPATWGVYVRDRSLVADVKTVLESYDEVSAVVEASRIYPGLRPSAFPDLFVIPNEGVEFSHKLAGWVSKSVQRGGHTIRGILHVEGEGVNCSCGRTPRVQDIAPTVLHVLGLPVPKHISGRVLHGLFEGG